MSWVMRSPSCSQTFRSCARRRVLGVVDEQVAAAAARSAARCARPPRRGPSATGSRRAAQEAHRREDIDPRETRRLLYGFFTVRSRVCNSSTHGWVGRFRVVAAYPESAEPTLTSSTPASSRSGSARGSCSPPAGRSRCRCASSNCSSRWRERQGAIITREELYRTVWGGELRRGRPLRRRVREQAARQARGRAARPPLHPHPPGLRLPLPARAFTRCSHARHTERLEETDRCDGFHRHVRIACRRTTRCA